MTVELLVVVDTEEEFDWSQPFSRDATATRSIPAQARAHEIFDGFGIIPTYVVDYPVATDPVAMRFLTGLRDAGRAELGAHLHPWVTPPFVEAVNARDSYACNLPPSLERAKIEALVAAIAAAAGEPPVIFKAGRYGLGSATITTLAELGFEVDCSIVPHCDFGSDGGPDFRGRPDRPFWLDEAAGLLEVPLSVGFFGAAAGLGPVAAGLFDSPTAARLRVPALLARSGLVSRARLTPEGVGEGEQIRLIRAMHDRGHRLFSLTYHSPSLAPGHTPYVRNEADLSAFLGRLERVLGFFAGELGGQFTTLGRVRQAWGARRKAA